MKYICPYFKDNKCASEYLSKLKLSTIAVCATGEHVNCPIYIETVKKENGEKEIRK